MPEDNENTEQRVVQKSSKLKFIIIGLIVILLLVVILFVVYMLVLAPKEEITEQAAQAPAVQAPAQAPAPAPAVQSAAPAPVMGGGMDMGVSNAEMGQIYPIPTLTVNLADPTGITYLAITLALEFDPKNADLLAEVEAKMPRINDMIITTLSSKAYEEISTSQGKVNLKNEFLRRINAMLAKGRLYNIYITSFTVQRG